MGPEESLAELISSNEHLGVLRYVRAHKLREPQIVVKHGKAALGLGEEGNGASPGLGPAERLSALEQVCLAALDLGEHSLAERCLDRLGAGSPQSLVAEDSARYRVLLAACMEASGDLEAASALCDALLKENPANGQALKRKYCVLAAQPGKREEATQALNDYLQQRPGDVAAWHEMAEACLAASDFKGAAFCYEEVLLGCPLEADLHVKLGEVYATVGGLEATKLARKHLAQALAIDPANLRAWFALLAAAEAYLHELDRAGKARRDLEQESMDAAKQLILLGAENLSSRYATTNLAPTLRALLETTSAHL